MIAIYRAEDGSEVRKHGQQWVKVGDTMQTAQDVHAGRSRVYTCVELVPDKEIANTYDQRANVGVIVKEYHHVSRQLPRWHPDAPHYDSQGRAAFRSKREVEEFQAKTQYGWDKQ